MALWSLILLFWKLSSFLFICVVAKIPKGHNSNNSNISDYVNIVEITSTQHYTRIGSLNRKCQEMIQWKQRVQKLHRFDVETIYKNPRGELFDISSILKVESMTKFPRRIDVMISTWICLPKSMKFRQNFHLEIRRRIDGESKKIHPFGTLLLFKLRI